MRELMQEIINRLYTFYLEADDPNLQATVPRWMGAMTTWDDPEIDPGMLGSARRLEGSRSPPLAIDRSKDQT